MGEKDYFMFLEEQNMIIGIKIVKTKKSPEDLASGDFLLSVVGFN